MLVPLDALTEHLAAAVARFGLTEDDVVLQFARPTVDVAIEQILGTLAAGPAWSCRSASCSPPPSCSTCWTPKA
ncbi:hypothetical protein ACFSUJ_34660 [Streptomyces lusitanus]|uniref:hypothetical protein n=1 Tax=Streptomyces lusitanus TaxID=68232 RepID=UPI00362AF9BA